MRLIGAIFIIFGVTAVFWWFMHKVPWLIQWIYQWGEPVAWAIKGGLIVAGLVLITVSKRRQRTRKVE
jgi:hypothetical protein